MKNFFYLFWADKATKVLINAHNVILIMDSPERKTQPTFYLTYIFVRKKVEYKIIYFVYQLITLIMDKVWL